ncbi:paeninodin family lasso peptide [Bacillaceae bacterium IKA-2]|nr:paeninodin family lasso peptide [Bacillaceae bacterium IKA-2]
MKKEWQTPVLTALDINLTEAGPLAKGKPDWTEEGGDES